VLNEAPRHEGVLGKWRYSSTYSLTSALDGGESSDSRLCRFTPRKRTPGTHWIGGWVGPRAVLDAVVKRKIPNPRRESNPRTPIVQPVAQRYTDWVLPRTPCFVVSVYCPPKKPTRGNDPETHDYYFSAVKTSDHKTRHVGYKLRTYRTATSKKSRTGKCIYVTML
jgi:hypothetical protein